MMKSCDTNKIMMNKCLKKWVFADLLIGGVILLGFALRLRQYFFNRSLWLDEAFIAVAIRDGTWKEACIPPLEYSHVVPLLFCALSKLVITVLGPQDYIFRLVPLFFGCASLVLFYYLARFLFHARLGPILLSVFLFSCSPTLLYYSNEFKPYGVDVFASVVCLWCWSLWRERPTSPVVRWLLPFIGAFVVWFSFPAVFVLAGMGVAMYWNRRCNHGRVSLVWLGVCGAIWSLSFLTGYLLLIRPSMNEEPIRAFLTGFWSESEQAFAPFHPWAFVLWFGEKLACLCRGGYGIPLSSWVLGVWLLIGVYRAVVLYHSFAVIFGVTLFSVLAASLCRAYPFQGRMILFLHPFFIILMAMGIEGVAAGSVRLLRCPPLARWFFGVLGISVAFLFLMAARPLFNHPLPSQEIRAVLREVQKRRQEGEAVYVYFWSEPAFRFYGEQYGFVPDACACLLLKEPPSYFNEVIYRRRRGGASQQHFEKQEIIFGSVPVERPEFQLDMEQMKKKGCFWFIISHIEPPALHRICGVLEELNLDYSEQINVYGANAMRCVGRD